MKKATIIQTKHKGKDVFTLDLGKTRVEARYKSTRNAAIGAVRANKDWCQKQPFLNGVEITYPDGRTRMGWMHTTGKIQLKEFMAAKRTAKKATK